MRIFTCTPIAFGGGPDFFSRDSGLMCRGLQAVGCDSHAVMPGEAKSEDEPDLIRTAYSNLESAQWWKQQNIDALVLYAWGSPTYRRVAKAIQDAGIFLILNQDHGGLISPRAGFKNWLREQWILTGQGRSASACYHFLSLSARGLSFGLWRTDPRRAQHLKCGNVIACVSPKAAEYFQKLCQHYGGRSLAKRVTVIPHAVESHFSYSGNPKHRQVICIGRWQDERQKRTWRLIEVISSLLNLDPDVSVLIAGKQSPQLVQWYQSIKPRDQARVKLTGILTREELLKNLQESQVFYSPSGFESFGIAAAEALCCGNSVVAGKSVSMSSFEWFVSENSGRLAEPDLAKEHTQSLLDELNAWRDGHRDPFRISTIWCQRLHATQVAQSVIHHFQNRDSWTLDELR
jgi:glycosyltransferase involved in cell wall biosynthesis